MKAPRGGGVVRREAEGSLITGNGGGEVIAGQKYVAAEGVKHGEAGVQLFGFGEGNEALFVLLALAADHAHEGPVMGGGANPVGLLEAGES